MAIASIARRFLGGGRSRPKPRPGPTTGAARPAGGSSADAKAGRGVKKGLRRLLR